MHLYTPSITSPLSIEFKPIWSRRNFFIHPFFTHMYHQLHPERASKSIEILQNMLRLRILYIHNYILHVLRICSLIVKNKRAYARRDCIIVRLLRKLFIKTCVHPSRWTHESSYTTEILKWNLNISISMMSVLILENNADALVHFVDERIATARALYTIYFHCAREEERLYRIIACTKRVHLVVHAYLHAASFVVELPSCVLFSLPLIPFLEKGREEIFKESHD